MFFNICVYRSIFKTYTLVYYYILFLEVDTNQIYTSVYYSSTYVYTGRYIPDVYTCVLFKYIVYTGRYIPDLYTCVLLYIVSNMHLFIKH
ncbi:hypothetical protein HanIR_Chr03g0110411 [Helianthus annuus]|nr:hypothetical protein HanIR_Chr03g0110411 [Helianthus annuus]